jgi:zinc transport system substrate-binding protein
MKNILKCLLIVLTGLTLTQVQAYAQEKKCSLNIGASLHPYYSWVKNIVGDAANVTSLIPSGSDPHAYQPVPSDMKMLENLDVVVVNGIGHDEFIKPMLKAIENDKLRIIDTSKGLPLIPTFSKHYSFEEQKNAKVSYNSHTYIAITGAIQQMQMITRKLGRLCPDRAGEFIRNVRAYSAKLRNMLQSTLMRIDMLNLNNLRIATVHDGYSYLFQELGIEVSAVVQPRHGVKPSARQLQDTIKRIKRAKVNVLFGEQDYEKKYVDIIYKETGCRLYALSHISNGEYTKEFFERTMRKNMDTIVAALTEVAEGMIPGGMPGDQQEQQQEKMSRQMRDSMKNNLQKAVPAMQQEKQQEKMSERMNRQLQDTTRQMQDTVKDNLLNAVPDAQSEQQKQMSESMSKKMRNTVKDNLRKIAPVARPRQDKDQ